MIDFDNVILSSIENFHNGCNFSITIMDNEAFIEYGCYGVHHNLVQGNKLLLDCWLKEKITQEGKELIKLPIKKNTIFGLSKGGLYISSVTGESTGNRRPCAICNAPYLFNKN